MKRSDENIAPFLQSRTEFPEKNDNDSKLSRITQVFRDKFLTEDLSLTYSPSPMVPKKRLANITNVDNIEIVDVSKKTLPFGLITFTPNKEADVIANETIEAVQTGITFQDQPVKEGRTDKNAVRAKVIKSPIKPKMKKALKVSFKTKETDVRRKTDPKQVQKAIDLATKSVNQTLNISREAKLKSLKLKSTIGSKIRGELTQEKQSAASFQVETEQAKRQILDIRSQLFTDYTKRKTHQNRLEYSQHLENLSKEMEFKSNVYVEHKKLLKENAEARRRKSVNIKAMIRNEQKKQEERMKYESRVHDHDSYMLKWAGEEDAKKYLEQQAEERRQSLVFRNKEGRRHRELEEMWRVQELQRVHEDETLTAEAHKDEERYKDSCAKARRDSFAFRHQEGVRHRAVMQELKDIVNEQEHESYMLKWAGEEDAKKYLEQQAEERRQSLVFRNKEGRQHRELEEMWRVQELQRVHEDEKLTAEAHKDEERYKDSCAKARRDSFAFRHQEGVRHRAVIQQLQDIAKQQEHDSYMLKWAGEEDANKYLEQQAEERRQSLVFRNKEGRQHRELEEMRRVQEIHNEHEDELLKASDHKNLEEYRIKCATRDRASLQYRRTEAMVQRLKEEHAKECEIDENIKSRNLDDLARSDVLSYVAECKHRRRLSLAYRASERRRHKEWEDRQKEEEIDRVHTNNKFASLDRKYVELARQKERACIALNALRHAGCSFNVNPFAALLGDL